MASILGKAKAWINNDIICPHSCCDSRLNSYSQLTKHFFNYIFVIGQLVHCSRLTTHMHDDYRYIQLCRHCKCIWTTQCPHIIPDMGSLLYCLADYFRLTGINRYNYIMLRQSFHYRNYTLKLFFNRYWSSPWPGRFPSNINNSCPVFYHL